ncbi:hypothetical protein DXG01_005351 [Tephrocybe rancida]|nr:hypothetical protein DXG01_005351 [Tephrocybe rancida]
MWREYAAADFRWGTADPTVVSLEILTVLGAGPLCCYILMLLARSDPARHYWIVVLSTAELYGGMAYRQPEFGYLESTLPLGLSRSYEHHVRKSFSPDLSNLTTSSRWVIIPIALMVDSYGHIAGSLRAITKAKTN